ERGLLARLDDREPAALELRRVVDRLAAARLDDPLERRRPVGVLEAEKLRRAQDLAAVERRDPQALEAAVRGDLEPFVALALGDLPEQVADLDVALVAGRADRLEVSVHALAQLRIALELPVRLPQVERADVADREQRVRPGGGRAREDPGVQVQVVVGLCLLDVAGAAARHRLQLDQVEAHLRGERFRRGVELLRRERGEAPLVVGDDRHAAAPSSSGPPSEATNGRGNEPSPYGSRPWSSNPMRERPRSPGTMRRYPCRSCDSSTRRSSPAARTSLATCGGNGRGTFPCLRSWSANLVWATASTTPCVFGTSSVSRSQPVVRADSTNHFACLAPRSKSIPSA